MKLVGISGGKVSAGNVIDQEMVKLSGKNHPKALFIPTASEYPGTSSLTSEENYRLFQESFQQLGCTTDVLYLVKEKPSLKEIRTKIMSTNIVYVGGGSTQKMLRVWRKLGVDKTLKKALEQGIVIGGISAGTICWGKYGQTTELVKGSKKNFKLRGLGFIPLNICPHYDNHPARRPDLIKMIKRDGSTWLALDGFAAIEVIDDTYRIIASSDSANAYKVYRKKGKVLEEKVQKDSRFRPLKELLR